MSGTEKGSSKADTLVKVVLVFFISLLSFSVGTFVGKQVSDSDHRRMALEGEYKAERSIASTEGKDGESADKISEKEVESLTEEFVNKEKMAASEGEEEAPAATTGHGGGDKHAAAEPAGYKPYNRGGNKEAHGAPAADAAHGEVAKEDAHKADAHAAKADAPKAKAGKAIADATHGVAEKVAKGEAPSDGMKEERQPASTLPSVAGSAVGKYTVQVASYADEKEAKNHAADLKGKGYNSFYFPAAVQGKTWYRVSVGLFNNFKSATDFRAQFMIDAKTKSAIVQKIVQ